MNNELLGELVPDPTVSDWWVSDEIRVSYFPDTPLRFVLEDINSDPAPAEFASAVKNFIGLTLGDRAEATPCVFKNYTKFIEVIGEEEAREYFDFVIVAPDDVWGHVYPSEVHVLRRPHGDKKVYVSIAANCDWEEEHGL